MLKQNGIRCGLSALIVAELVFAAQLAWAQETTGSISGTVKDSSGAVIAKAKVTLTDTDKNVEARPTFPTCHHSGKYPCLARRR
jgi:hypothetical protein